MSEDKKNSSSSSDSSDPLFDGLKSGNASQSADPPPKIVKTDPPEPVKYKPVTGGQKTSRFRYLLSEKLTRKEFIIGAIIFVILLGSAVAFGLNHKAGAPMLGMTKSQPPAKPAVYYSPLTGVPVKQSETTKTVTGVMIENSDFARPQSGLKEAGVVYEAIAEAGITRFMALYQEATPGNIGPIRSARPYYLAWALPFQAAYSHVGGSPEALADISHWGVRDMNEFYYGSYYHRVGYREAPHNMYTNISSLNAIEKKNGWTTSKFHGFPRKAQSPSQHPNAREINFSISSSDFHVYYRYDSKHNGYLRWEGGAPHMDATTKTQLEPRVVIGIVLPYSIESDNYHSMYNTSGSGRAYIFQDGTYTIGMWHKTDRNSQISFTDNNGKVVALNPGQTWITALAKTTDASYKP